MMEDILVLGHRQYHHFQIPFISFLFKYVNVGNYLIETREREGKSKSRGNHA